jgi:hypothetical protein
VLARSGLGVSSPESHAIKHTTVGLSIGLGLAMLIGWGLRAAFYQIARSIR